VRLTGRGYLLAALAAALAVAGCASAGPQVAGTGRPSGSTGTSPAAKAQAVGGGTSATSSPAAPGGPVATASAASHGAVPECTTAELKVTESDGNGVGDTASGHAALALRFTNVGSRACFLRGYPGVAVSGPGGVLNAQRVMRGYMGGDAGQAPSLVIVPPGETAAALLEWLFSPQDGSATVTTRNCPGYHAARLLVIAPDQTTAAVFAAPGTVTPVCWGFEVHPVVSGATGRSY
jgi:hypothetical protein